MVDFSVITVCRNDLERLIVTAKSVASQARETFEWLVVDGDSTDGTRDYLAACNLVTRYLSEPDKGIYDAMNKGVGLARGEYCLFLNAGDTLHDSEVLKRVRAYRGAELLVGQIVEVSPDSNHQRVKNLENYTISRHSLFRRTLPHQATFMKTALFAEHGGYDVSYQVLGDHDFFARIFTSRQISLTYLPFPVAFYSLDGVSAASKKSGLFPQELEQVRLRNYSFAYRLARWFYSVTIGANR